MTWIALGVGYLLICLPIHALALRGPKRNGDPKRNKTSDPQWPQLTGRARHQGMLWMIVSFVCSGYLMGAVMTLWVTNVQDFGHSATMAAAAGAVIDPFKTVGRFLEMLASRALYPMATYALSLSLMLSGFGVLLVFGLTVPGLMIAAALYGMGDGLMTIARATMPLALFGRAGYGAPGLDFLCANERKCLRTFCLCVDHRSLRRLVVLRGHGVLPVPRSCLLPVDP